MNTHASRRIDFSVWLAFFIITAIYTFTFLYRMAPSSMALFIAEDLRFSISEMSLIGSATILGFGIMQLPSGLLSDRIGGKKTLVLLTLLAGISTVWFSMAQSIESVAMSRFLTGLGVSATIPCTAILAHMIPPTLFARVSNTMYGMGALGTIAAAAPLTLASTAFGWRPSMFACGMMSLLLAGLLFWFVRQPDSAQASPVRPRQSLRSGIARVLTTRHFWFLCIAYSGTMIAFLGFYGLWFGPYLVQACGLSKIEAGTVQSIGAMASIVGMPMGAVLSDRIQSRKKIILPMLGAATVCVALFMFFPGRLPAPVLTALAAIFTFCNGAAGLCFISCKELFPLSIMGSATGCLNTLPPLLGAASQKLFGMLLELGQAHGFDTAHAYSFSMLLYVAVLFCATAASCFLRETHPSAYSAKEFQE